MLGKIILMSQLKNGYQTYLAPLSLLKIISDMCTHDVTQITLPSIIMACVFGDSTSFAIVNFALALRHADMRTVCIMNCLDEIYIFI